LCRNKEKEDEDRPTSFTVSSEMARSKERSDEAQFGKRALAIERGASSMNSAKKKETKLSTCMGGMKEENPQRSRRTWRIKTLPALL